ncbi:hypothetical protein KI688_005061 [Linnemannia hyalina]|uniref:NADP-dependent oxidoreductase domain-containing protein n=1 Tax=Linnemannia hyalina TaxID=64524 RepID=A0A9P8BNY4_9FUNG|nr:hypothetical protein KI688_005061 [Linnemannia hyalina]
MPSVGRMSLPMTNNWARTGFGTKRLSTPASLKLSGQGIDSSLLRIKATMHVTKVTVTDSLRNLQVDYIDLYLIHWPGTAKLKLPDPQNAINRMESWRALEGLYHAKKLRAIGVSNYTLAHLAQLIERPHKSHAPHQNSTTTATETAAPLARTMVIPHVHQFEMHPRLFQKPLVDYCQAHRIQVQAYSSLGESRLVSLTPPPPPAMDSNYNTAPLPGALDIMPGLIRKYFAHVTSTTAHLSEEEEKEEYPRRAAQILLRWGLQHGAVVIPKSTHPERIRNNIDLFSFAIDNQVNPVLSCYLTDLDIRVYLPVQALTYDH